MDNFSHNRIDSGDEHAGYESDPALKSIIDQKKLQKTAGVEEVVRTMHNVYWAGTNTKEELRELECHLMELLNEGKYGYMYIQNFLRSMGYQEKLVRQTFRKLTGVDPDIYQDPQPFLDTPGTIPGLNYGWGKSKDKKHDFYFIMPYNLGYQVFGQKGDLERTEVVYFLELDKAREYLTKHTEEALWWDKVKEHNIKDKKTMQELSEPVGIGNKTAKYQQLEQYFNQLGNMITYTEKRASIKDAFSKKEITAEEHIDLLSRHGMNRYAAPEAEVSTMSDKEKEHKTNELASELEDDAEKLMGMPIEDELNEVSPSSFFETQKEDRLQDDLHLYIKHVTDYLSALNSELSEFKLEMRSFKYMKKSVSSRMEDNVVAPGQQVDEILLAGATIAVVVCIKDQTLPSERNEKLGFTIFTVLDGELLTSGTFKGENNKVYSLSEEGFDKYFYEERNQSR